MNPDKHVKFTIMFPLSILYLSSGVLFTPFIAVMVSMVGLATTITIPYWIGRYSGEDIIQYIGTRYPNGKLVMPVSVRLNHAIADGYLVANVFRLLEQEIKAFVGL